MDRWRDLGRDLDLHFDVVGSLLASSFVEPHLHPWNCHIYYNDSIITDTTIQHPSLIAPQLDVLNL